MRSKLILLVILFIVLLFLNGSTKQINQEVSPAQDFITTTPTQILSPTLSPTVTPTLIITATPTVTPSKTPTPTPNDPCDDCKGKKCQGIPCFDYR